MNESAMRRAIARKRDGGVLDEREWASAVTALLDGSVDEAQFAALLMACVWRGLDEGEASALTAAFVASGERLEAPDPRTLDKHSSGGVADTASLIVVPMVAACGVPVAKLSGHALGHTGGTLDKLESIEGVHVDLEPERFFACVREAGCAIAAQSARLVPADKRIYALRDRTATVPSRGLIAASIVSKKIAGGANAITYDVKFGSGAFMADANEARELAETLVSITRAFGRSAAALVTDMNEPLGPAIGTGLEAIEARDFLSGARRDPRLAALCAALGTRMLELARVPEAARELDRALTSGRAYETFERMLAAQGAVAGALAALAPHRTRTPVFAARSGFVTAFELVALGDRVRDLVAEHGDGAGVTVAVRIGHEVRAGDEIAAVYGDPHAVLAVGETIAIGEPAPAARALVAYETATGTAASLAVSAVRSTDEIK